MSKILKKPGKKCQKCQRIGKNLQKYKNRKKCQK